MLLVSTARYIRPYTSLHADTPGVDRPEHVAALATTNDSGGCNDLQDADQREAGRRRQDAGRVQSGDGRRAGDLSTRRRGPTRRGGGSGQGGVPGLVGAELQ